MRAPVPISAFTRMHNTSASLAVNHQGQFPVVTLSFNLAPGASLGQATKAIQQAEKDIQLPRQHSRVISRNGGSLSELAGFGALSDPGRGDHGVHRAGRVVRELHPSRSRFFPRCRPRAWERFSR